MGKTWLWRGCFLGLTLGVAVVSFAAEPTPAQRLVHTPGVLITAHRGNSSVAPENTLPAFEAALEAKCDLVELDYYHSADGVPVVIHDSILDRTTDAEEVLGQPKLTVGAQRLADLQKLDVGSWFDDKFAGARIPTLLQSLAVIQPRSVTLIERKAGDAPALVKLLQEQKLLEQVVVQAFDFEFVAACRQLSPTLALGALCGKTANMEQIKAAADTGADLIVWNHEKLGREQVDQIHQLGKKAWVYTVDDPARARLLISWGIDGIITNKPGDMVQLRDRVRPAR
jgi:glycerophosphoryl diester phosphodiesterase